MVSSEERFKNSKYNIVIDKNDKFVFIYNCYSGGIIKLENEIYNTIKNDSFKSTDVQYFNELVNEGYIVEVNINEYQRARIKAKVALNDYHPQQVSYVIAPTLRCNLNCIYCFEKNIDVREDMNDEVIDNLIDFIISQNYNNKNLKEIKVTWFGGEPLLGFSTILKISRKLIKTLEKINITFSSKIITNGVLFNKKTVKILKEECNLTHAQISIDGTENNYCQKKQTNVKIYNTVINNICDNCDDIKIKVRLNTDKTNFEDMKLLSKYLLDKKGLNERIEIYMAQLQNYDLDYTTNENFFNIEEYEKAKDNFNSYLFQNKYLKKEMHNKPPAFHPFFCGLLKLNNFVIGPKGEIYKCQHYIGHSDKIVGNVKDGIWYNEEYVSFINGTIDQRCQACNIYPSCRASECPEIHQFCGNEASCKRFDSNLKAIKYRALEYIRRMK